MNIKILKLIFYVPGQGEIKIFFIKKMMSVRIGGNVYAWKCLSLRKALMEAREIYEQIEKLRGEVENEREGTGMAH